MCFSSLDWETLVESQELHYLPQQTYVQTRTDPMMNTKCNPVLESFHFHVAAHSKDGDTF